MPAADGPVVEIPTRHPLGVGLRSCPPRGGATVVFWLLVLMGLATFTPCVLLPQWRQYQNLRSAEQTAQHRLDVLRTRVAQQERLLEALHSDPAVVARFAQRDLGFRRPLERVIPVSVPATAAAPPTIPAPHRCSAASCGWHMQPVQPPPVIARALSYLPDYNYNRIFCDDDTRPILMGSSVAIIALAFALYSRRLSGPGALAPRG